MKKLLLSLTVILLFAASCTTGKSFLKQRYTNLGHKKNHVSTGNKQEYAQARKHAKPAEPIAAAEPVILKPAVAEAPQTVNAQPAVLTANANTAVKQNAKAPALTNNAAPGSNIIHTFAKKGFSQLSDSQVKKEQSKRGLLFGIISDLLSIIFIIILVALIIFLVLVLF